MNIENLTGLEILQSMMTGALPPPSMALAMNMNLVYIEQGFARFEATANDSLLNPMGSVHGGFASAVLDSALGCAIHSALQVGESYGTIDLNIKFLRPVPINTKLFAEGKLINLSHTLGVSNGQLMDEDGKIYAYGACTCKIIK